jgi:hypothetical protein
MNEIKVIVSYEKPATTKFDALMEEYKAAKKIADETVAYYKPLADAAEEAKMDAILEQIEPIIGYAKQLAQITEKDRITICSYVNQSQSGYYDLLSFTVEYKAFADKTVIRWGVASFNKENLKTRPGYFTGYDCNILGNWDKWNIYQGLENNAISQLKTAIEMQHKKGREQVDRLNNIQKGVN